MAARRAVQAKALASQSNLAQLGAGEQAQRARLKSTSMTNLATQSGARQLQRPASRNALDNIHKGMNAKFTHVQSKVLLQHIRPQGASSPAAAGSRIPATPGSTLGRQRPTAATTAAGKRAQVAQASAGPRSQQSDRSQLINKIKALQEELAGQTEARERLKAELERERRDKRDELDQVKLELQERARESERQNEEHHQKLLEAYELADQNRRAADGVLSESRQREDELRRRIEELERQLGELREFASQKEETLSKLAEMRDQIRVERERYEEKTRSLGQMFESEKISGQPEPHMRVDQNSNYFKRARPALQSVESLNRLAGEQHRDQAQQQQRPGQAEGAGQQHRSAHDLYGSKLSTRVQDGARFAWKRSRKFASSVISGSLGGLSACRKREGGLFKGARSQGRAPVAAHEAQEAAARGEQHTSVIEVGEQPQQQRGEGAGGEPQPRAICARDAAGEQQAMEERARQQQQHISVDENNKLTIVTKFNGSETTAAGANQPSSGSAGSERSRCESSSSGRGTASDSGSSGSQNGDLEQASREAAVASSGAGAANEPEQRQHKRKSSLFKASSLLGGSQASLNKSLRSFLALAAGSGSAQKLPAAAGHHDERRGSLSQQSAPFDLEATTSFRRLPRLDAAEPAAAMGPLPHSVH